MKTVSRFAGQASSLRLDRARTNSARWPTTACAFTLDSNLVDAWAGNQASQIRTVMRSNT